MEKLETKFTTIGKYYAEHFNDLRAFVVSRIKETEYADDIVQNVFIKLLSIDKILTEESLSNLVYTITRNLIYDYYRHKNQWMIILVMLCLKLKRTLVMTFPIIHLRKLSKYLIAEFRN